MRFSAVKDQAGASVTRLVVTGQTCAALTFNTGVCHKVACRVTKGMISP